MFKLKQRSELISILPMLIAVDSVGGLAAQSPPPPQILSVDVFTTQLLSLTTLHSIFTSRKEDGTGILRGHRVMRSKRSILQILRPCMIIGAAQRIKTATSRSADSCDLSINRAKPRLS